ERWMNTEIEQPALSALEKLQTGRRLTRSEWCGLTMYVFALDQRTPTGFMALCRRAQEIIPALLESTLQDVRERLAQREFDTRSSDTQAVGVNSRFPLKVTTSQAPDDEGRGVLRAEVTVGRELWLWMMRTILPTTGKRLAGSVRWSI